jgi:hypothetical protein
LFRQVLEAGLDKKQDRVSKISRAKRAESVTQAVEHLPGKCEALGSNCSTAKREK